MSISAVVLTHNNIQTISRCLKSLKWVDELIVVDSYSDDGTEKIIDKRADTVIQRQEPDPGEPYDHYRRDGFAEATNEWIVNIDSDEWITPTLVRELKSIAKENRADVVYSPKKNFVGDRWVDAGFWWPDYTLVMVKQGYISISPEIHNFYDIKPDAQRLKIPVTEDIAIRHQLFDSYFHAFRVNHRYGRIRGNQESFTLPKLAAFPYTFWKIYIQRRSYRAGLPGFILSLSHALYRTEAAYRALYRTLVNS